MSTTHYLVIMLIWLSFEALASLVAWASATELGRSSAAAGRALQALARLALVTLTILQLGGCGGGDPLPDTPPPGVDCATQPDLCV